MRLSCVSFLLEKCAELFFFCRPNETTSLCTAAGGECECECKCERGLLLLLRQERGRIRRCIAIGLLALVLSIASSAAIFLAAFDSDCNNRGPGNSDSDSDGTNYITPLNNITFPPDFVWGSATLSYQVEGAADQDGWGGSIWDTFCQDSGRILENATGNVTCNHYHLYEKDVLLMKDLHLRAYRFSISWSRILPSGYAHGEDRNLAINQPGIDFYNRLIDALLGHGIKPWVTQYHWDLPQALENNVGGWLDPGGSTIVKAFGDYSRVCYSAFGDRVKRWITLNEP